MNNFIPFDKLSKKKQKEFNDKKRMNWGNINPITRKSINYKKYNRNNFKIKDYEI